MKIKVLYVGYLDIQGVALGSEEEVAAGTTIGDWLTAHGITEEHQKYVTPFVNGQKRRPEATLQADDEIFLLVPLGGG